MKKTLLFILLLVSNLIFAQNYVAFADEMPVFSGCENIFDSKQRCECTKTQFTNYIETKLSSIDKSKDSEVTIINLGFIIDRNGLPINLELLDGESLDVDIKNKIIESMSHLYEDGIILSPGRNSGKIVNVKMILPVRV